MMQFSTRSPIEVGIRVWNEKRGSRKMASMCDFEGEDFEPLRANAILMEVCRGPLDFRYRAIGTNVTSRTFRDYSGACMSEIPHQAPPSKVWSSLVRVAEEQVPLFSDVPYVGPDHGVTIYRDVMLPLSGNGRIVDAVLVIVEFECRPYTVHVQPAALPATFEDAKPRNDGEREMAKIIGNSPQIHELRERLAQLLTAERSLDDHEAPPVLILGETGTGKNLVARVLHFDGARREGPFIEPRFSSIPPHLAEAELFGCEPGVLEDAPQGKVGLVEAAEGGTLFLNELRELDHLAQARVLRLLEERRLRRLGSAQARAIDVRIIAATNQPLDEMVKAKTLRADLCYRLMGVMLELPRLHDRGADILLLAEHFLEHHSRRYGKPALKFDPPAIQAIIGHHWPGNVRELSNAIEQAVVMTSGDTVGREHLRMRPAARSQAPGPFEDSSTIIVSAYSGDKIQMTQVERGLIVKALEHCHGNVSEAARTLGISRDQLRYRIAKYGLE